MEIDLLYIPECPNRSVARGHLELALARTRLAATMREREVHSGEEAAVLGMQGSPTILIDGRDPFSDVPGVTALACRLYRREAGWSGAPTVEQLVEVLARKKLAQQNEA
jgi:hypothetical protein